jgi:hypothetical protein
LPRIGSSGDEMTRRNPAAPARSGEVGLLN